MNCAGCGRQLAPGPYSRRDTCPGCGCDLHACLQCTFYAPGHYNDCREPQAERVLDKQRANFCDFFRPASDRPDAAATDERQATRAKLDALFGKSAK